MSHFSARNHDQPVEIEKWKPRPADRDVFKATLLEQLSQTVCSEMATMTDVAIKSRPWATGHRDHESTSQSQVVGNVAKQDLRLIHVLEYLRTHGERSHAALVVVELLLLQKITLREVGRHAASERGAHSTLYPFGADVDPSHLRLRKRLRQHQREFALSTSDLKDYGIGIDRPKSLEDESASICGSGIPCYSITEHAPVPVPVVVLGLSRCWSSEEAELDYKRYPASAASR